MFTTIAGLVTAVLGVVATILKLRKNSTTAAQAQATAQAYSDADKVIAATSRTTDDTRTQLSKDTNANQDQTAALTAGVATAGSLSGGAADLDAAINDANARNRASD